MLPDDDKSDGKVNGQETQLGDELLGQVVPRCVQVFAKNFSPLLLCHVAV